MLRKGGLKVRASAADRDSAGERKPPSADPRAGNAPAPGGPSIFAALQEQLGLKLESGKVPAEVLAIDSAEKPSQD
jgi:uncharacterized protein (TIGR03435 family)